jgi:hypothetical protein
LKILKKYLNNNLKREYIQYFISSVEISILFILKKDRSLRLYVDYRGLNKITIKNRYPFLLIGKILNRFNGAAIYTKFDLKKIYYKIRIKKRDEWKTIFKIRYDYFKYKMIFFDLINISAIFQVYINRVLVDLINISCVVYFDNIFIYLINRAKYQQYIRQIFERLRQYKLYIKLFKFEFSAISIIFLRFVINIREIEMDENKIKIIAK